MTLCENDTRVSRAARPGKFSSDADADADKEADERPRLRAAIKPSRLRLRAARRCAGDSTADADDIDDELPDAKIMLLEV